jgi:hypothetical protein
MENCSNLKVVIRAHPDTCELYMTKKIDTTSKDRNYTLFTPTTLQTPSAVRTAVEGQPSHIGGGGDHVF